MTSFTKRMILFSLLAFLLVYGLFYLYLGYSVSIFHDLLHEVIWKSDPTLKYPVGGRTLTLRYQGIYIGTALLSIAVIAITLSSFLKIRQAANGDDENSGNESGTVRINLKNYLVGNCIFTFGIIQMNYLFFYYFLNFQRYVTGSVVEVGGESLSSMLSNPNVDLLFDSHLSLLYIWNAILTLAIAFSLYCFSRYLSKMQIDKIIVISSERQYKKYLYGYMLLVPVFTLAFIFVTRSS